MTSKPFRQLQDALPEGASPWDAIVIGSGIGGLASAALMAKAGLKVLILEKHYVAGGFTHTFERKGYEWDVGIHYIGEVHRKNALLRVVSDDLSNGALQWSPMPEVYDRAVFGTDTYDFVAGRQRLRGRLHEYFPQETGAIDRYFDLVDQVARAARGYFMEKALPDWASAVAAPFLRRKFLEWSDKTTWEVLSSLTTDERLIGVLTTQYGDYGLPPRASSFAIHAIVARHYFEGGSYPVGGSGRIAESIIPVIESSGGRVLTSADVAKIVIRNNRACGVLLASGEEIPSRRVISDAGIWNTFGRLVDEDIAKRLKWPQRLSEVRPSYPHVCLYLGLNVPFSELKVDSSNLWIFPGYDHDASVERYLRDAHAPLPVTYISFPSSKDPEWDQRHPGRSTIEAVSFVPYDWFKKWEGSKWMKRGAEYESLKKEFGERLLAEVERQVPLVKGKVDYREVSTPLSTRHFSNYAHGEIYGLDHTPDRFRRRWLRPGTPVKGLFLTGQDICTAGYGGALMGGVLTASVVLKRNLISDIMKRR